MIWTVAFGILEKLKKAMQTMEKPQAVIEAEKLVS